MSTVFTAGWDIVYVWNSFLYIDFTLSEQNIMFEVFWTGIRQFFIYTKKVKAAVNYLGWIL